MSSLTSIIAEREPQVSAAPAQIAVLEKLLLRPMDGIQVNRDSDELVPDELNILG